MKNPTILITKYERYDVHHPNYAWMCRQPDGVWSIYCQMGPSWGWNNVINRWVICTLMDRYDRGDFCMSFEQAMNVMETVPSKNGISGEHQININ